MRGMPADVQQERRPSKQGRGDVVLSMQEERGEENGEYAEAGACMECGRGKMSTGGRSVCAPREVSERMGLVGMMRPDGAGRKMERQCEHFHGGPYRVSNAWLGDQLTQHTQ